MTFVLINANRTLEKKIEINSIEQMMALAEKYNNAIIFYPKSDYYSSLYNYPVIQIYDDYIE